MTAREPSAGPVWIDTDNDGFIVDWHPSGPALAGYSAQHLRMRDLALIFIAGRPQRTHLTHARQGHVVEFDGVVRPRDHRGVRMRCRIEPSPVDSSSLRWTFTLVGA
jgi:PAS domain-containing protein